MDNLGVPCPACGSVEVLVSPRSEAPRRAEGAGDPFKGHVPQLHNCACNGCRHRFQHDFAFSR